MEVTIKTENVKGYIKDHFVLDTERFPNGLNINRALNDEILVSKSSGLSGDDRLIIEQVISYDSRCNIISTHIYLMDEYDSVSLKGSLMKFEIKPIYKNGSINY